jgi:hypothetical protein
MCTLSVIQVGRSGAPRLAGEVGFRVVMNRDEQRDRPAALQPRWRWVGDDGRRAIWPIDPKGGGTWIGADDRGLVLCLLNLNLEPAPRLPEVLESRGAIIPRLMRAGDAAGALEVLAGLDHSRFAPFRLAIVEPTRRGRAWDEGASILVARWDRHTLTVLPPAEAPACLVSSGLGDSRVASRLDLFEDMLGQGGDPESQDAFHRHKWDDRPEASVLMSRDDARTVSITTVDVTSRGPGFVQARMAYKPVYALEHARLAVPAR